MSQHMLFYRQEARCWDEALPVGNGRLGAMIFGGTGEETVELNEDTLWGGYPRTPEAGSYFADLEHARQLLREGKNTAADRFISGSMLKHDSAGYLPAGKLKFDFQSRDVSGYRRKLDLRRAVHTVESGGEFSQWFASFPDQVLAMRYRGAGFAVSLDSALEHETCGEGGEIWLEGRCPVYARRDELRQADEKRACGIRFQIRVRLLAPAGTVVNDGTRLRFSGGEALLLVAIRSSFIDWQTMPDALDYGDKCKCDLDRAAAVGFAQLLANHLADYQALYRRSELTLPETADDELPTDERLKRCGDTFSVALAALLYHFGRYLLIASSRPGTQPANLQGIWNPHVLAPWGSNYTTNINLEMNYWPAEGANLAECAEPLLCFAEECARSGARTAHDFYRASGWCLHHNSDLWRHTAPASGQARWGFWPVGGLWLCRHLFEHYQYSLDPAELLRFYPVLRGAAEFLLDFLVVNERGEATTSPATSPENGFIDPATGESACVCGDGSAMDLELAAEALEHVLEAGRILKLDEPLAPRFREALNKLRPLKIGSEGQLLEYDADYPEAEIHHRHLSHLYGAYPGERFTPERNPELFKACEVSLVRRGDHSTGWAMGWRLALWARFRNPVKTKVMLKEFLTPIDPAAKIGNQAGGIYPNLFAAHPPFQIDANFGGVAGILEMLIQSHRQTEAGLPILELLPAVPDDWREGSLSGVRCRGGLLVDFAWRDGAVTRLRIAARVARTIRLVTPQGIDTITLAAGENCEKNDWGENHGTL